MLALDRSEWSDQCHAWSVLPPLSSQGEPRYPRKESSLILARRAPLSSQGELHYPRKESHFRYPLDRAVSVTADTDLDVVPLARIKPGIVSRSTEYPNLFPLPYPLIRLFIYEYPPLFITPANPSKKFFFVFNSI
jgi:hypothetical protein